MNCLGMLNTMEGGESVKHTSMKRDHNRKYRSQVHARKALHCVILSEDGNDCAAVELYKETPCMFGCCLC